MRRSRVPVLSALLIVGLLLAGCSGGDTSAETAPSDSAGGAGGGAAPLGGGGEQAAPGAPQPDGGDSGGDAGGGGAVTSLRVSPGDALIRTADLSVRVDDVQAAADEASRIAVSAAGSVTAEERSSGGQDASAVVVLRVPPSAFDGVLGRLSALGEEEERLVDTQDVTDQVVDFDSRIATQRASVVRVRALLDRADELGEVVQVESELTKRTADLESLQARLAALEEQVDLATITLRLYSSDEPLSGAAPPGFRDGLSAGWNAVVVAARLVGVTAGALLPFSPLLLVGGLLLHRSRSRRAASA